MIFVDTSAWFALTAPGDPHHQDARRLIQGAVDRLVTTDYVVDETLTLLKVRRSTQRALVFGAEMLHGELAELIWVGASDFANGWSIFERYNDKGWSFTDCVSFAVMRRAGIHQAIAFDEHFRQLGGIEVLQ